MNRTSAVRRTSLILYWTAIFALTHWPKLDDFGPVHWFPVGFDKAVHFCFYAVWTALWCWFLSGRGIPVSSRVAGWLVAGGAAYAVMDELTQAIVSRDPDVGDFVADMTGVVLVLFLMNWFFRRRARLQPERRREQAL